MRILVATDQWFPDYVAGPARLAAESAKRLAHRGHDLVVLAPRHPNTPRVSVDEGVEVHRVLARNALPQTVTDVLGAGRYSRRLRSAAFDVALAHQPTVAAGVTAARPDLPTALLYHASALRELRFLRQSLVGPRRLASYPLAAVLALVERAAMGRCSSVLVLSDYSRSLVVADHPRGARKTERIDAGIETASFDPGEGRLEAREQLSVPENETLLVTARRLEPRTGVDRLVRAVRELADARLVVIGAGPLMAELRTLATDLGVDPRVRFLGRVSDEALRQWMRAADLFVLPTVAYEGFGMVTAEALACGTPVIGTPVGATPELLEPLDHRLVAESPEPEALAAAIMSVLPLANQAFRGKCRDYASGRFDWDHAIVGWESALTRAAESRQTSAP
jgi:glycosyltransferase involved in cell wall biosynthesis